MSEANQNFENHETKIFNKLKNISNTKSVNNYTPSKIKIQEPIELSEEEKLLFSLKKVILSDDEELKQAQEILVQTLGNHPLPEHIGAIYHGFFENEKAIIIHLNKKIKFEIEKINNVQVLNRVFFRKQIDLNGELVTMQISDNFKHGVKELDSKYYHVK